MAGPKGSKYFDIFLDYQVNLSRKSGAGKLDDDLVRLLSAIESSGSLKLAAIELGWSYRKAWGNLKEAERFIGFDLVETIRGGKDGGLSRLTDSGKELIQAFSELHEEFDLAIYRITRKFFHKLNNPEEQTPEKSH